MSKKDYQLFISKKKPHDQFSSKPKNTHFKQKKQQY